MGYAFNRDKNKRGYAANQVSNYETRLGAIGQEVPPEKKKEGLLLKTLDILDRPRNAIVNAIQDSATGENSFWQGLGEGFTGKEKASASDLLRLAGVENKAALGIGGFLGDVALNPATYASLGGGVALKTAAKAGAGALAKTGIPAAIKSTAIGRKAGEIGQSLGKSLIPRFGLPEEYATLKQGYAHGLNYLRDKKLDYIGSIAKKNNLTADETKLVMEGLENPRSLIGADRRLVDATRELKGMYKRGIREEKLVYGKAKERKNYAPHVKTGAEQFETRGAMGSPLRPNDKFRKGRRVEGTVKDINARAGREIFDPNAITASAVREYSRLGGIQTKKFIDDTLSRFGRKIKPGAKADPGEGVYTVSNFRLYPVEDVFGSVHQAFSKKVPTYALPKEIADDLNKFYSTFVNDDSTKEFLKLYDKVQNLWKGIVTSPNPSFHIRNAIGNLWNNYLAGVYNPERYIQAGAIQKGVKGTLELGGKKYSHEQILDLAKRENILGFGQFGADIKAGVRDIAAQKAGQKTLNPLKLGRQAGSAIEDNAKLAHLIDRMGKGDSVEKAAQSVRKYLFDYADLTDVEKNVFRRVVPFYTFWRKNLPLQIESILTQPGKFAAVGALTENLGDAQGLDPSTLPEWMREQGAFPAGSLPGGKQRVITAGLPMADLNTLNLRDTLARLSPVLRTPIELATNQQLFSGIPIERYEGEKKNLFGVDMPAKAAFLLGQAGLTRIPGEYLGNLLDEDAPAKKLPVLGKFVKDFDPEKAEENAAYERLRQLADAVQALEARGVEVPTLAELGLAQRRTGKRRRYA